MKKIQKKLKGDFRSLEELTSIGEGTGMEVEARDDSKIAIRSPFDPEKIDVMTKAYSIYLLLQRLTEGELSLSPDFQRRANLWDEERKSRLIESMLLRIPLPSLYVSEDKGGSFTVIDGLQRLCAITHFVNVASLNKAVGSKLSPLVLDGLQSLREFKDYTYETLPRTLQRRLLETELTLHVIRAGTPPAVKFSIFSRLNQGGLPLSSQEIRQAIYPGEWRHYIRELAESDAFLAATERKIKAERMDDMELVLRFIALFNLPTFNRSSEQTLDTFLNETVEIDLPKWTNKKWAEAGKALVKGMTAAHTIFEEHAFRKYYGPDAPRNPINRGLFEAETIVLSKLNDAQIRNLASKRKLVLKGLQAEITGDKQFERSLRYATGYGASSNKRIETIQKILRKVSND